MTVGDSLTALPAGLDQDVLLQHLEPLARSGQIFFLVADDPVRYRIDSVLTRRPFDGARHAEDMSELLGADWRFMQTVDRLGLVGCLPLVLTAVCMLAAKWRWLWYVLPVLAVSWLPYIVLKRSHRYKAAERRAAEQEQSRPHYVLSLTPTQQDGLSGGFLRV